MEPCEDSGMDEEAVGGAGAAVQDEDEEQGQETGARTLLSKALFRKLAKAVLAELMSEAESDPEKSHAATLTAGAMEYLHQASEAHMQRVVKDGNTIATKVRSKVVGQPVDLRVGQSRGDPSTLEALLERAALDAQRGCPVSAFNSISDFLIKKFTKPAGFARVSEVFCQERRLALHRFMRVTLQYAVQTMKGSSRTRLREDDLDLAMRHCARSFL